MHWVLSGRTQRRTLPQIYINISSPRVGIEPTTSRFYSHTLCPCATTCHPIDLVSQTYFFSKILLHRRDSFWRSPKICVYNVINNTHNSKYLLSIKNFISCSVPIIFKIKSTGCGFDPHSKRWNINLNLYFHFFILVSRQNASRIRQKVGNGVSLH